jgi:hypothetical protein
MTTLALETDVRYFGSENRIEKIARAITTAAKSLFDCSPDQAVDLWVQAPLETKHEVEIQACKLLIEDQQTAQEAITALLYNMWMGVAGDQGEFLYFLDQIFPEGSNIRGRLLTKDGYGGPLFYNIIYAFQHHHSGYMNERDMFELIHDAVNWSAGKSSHKGGEALAAVGRVMKAKAEPEAVIAATEQIIEIVRDNKENPISRGEFRTQLLEASKTVSAPAPPAQYKTASIAQYTRYVSRTVSRTYEDVHGDTFRSESEMVYTFRIPIAATDKTDIEVRGANQIKSLYFYLEAIVKTLEQQKEQRNENV